MVCSMTGFPVLHHLLGFAQTHVHQIGDAIQSSHPLSSPSPPAFNLSQHQGHFLFFFFLMFLITLIYFFPIIFISRRLITLQYCSGFCHTLTRISHGFTCVLHPEPHSHLPPYPIPLGHPSAPAPSTCLMHPNWTGDLFHT